ncbi:MAG: hypothetical protein U1E56_00385 [Bauldia sp.]
MRTAWRWASAALFLAAASPAFADAWDDLAARIVAEKGATRLNRFDVRGEPTILMEQKGIAGNVSLVVADGTADLSYQLASNARPGEAVFALMADTATLVIGAAAPAILDNLRRCYEAVTRDPSGVAGSSAPGLSVDCILVPGGRLIFIIGRG